MPVEILILFAVLFPVGWCAILLIVSWTGGWWDLAKNYAVAAEPEGKRFEFQSIKVGHSNYSACLTIVVGGEGLYLRVFPMFRCGHPPLLIPWSEFHSLKEFKILWLWPMVEMRIGTPTIATLTLPLYIIEQRPIDRNGEREA
jgi:hypothetical protein